MSNITKYIEKLVGFYPTSSDQQNVKKLIDYVSAHLTKHGFVCEIIDNKGVYCLYAHPTGSKHSRLLLQGHIDVVPGKNQPFQIAGDKMLGRGVYDMLFATACYMNLIDEIGPFLAKQNVAILLSGDEELGGFNGVKAILENGYSTDCCILPDAGDGIGSLSVSAKGVYCIDIQITGKAHHASRPWEGDNAAYKLVKCIDKIYDQLSNQTDSRATVTLSRINAGEASNKGPSIATATLDIRYSDQASLKEVKQKISKILKEHSGQITDTEYAANYELDKNNPDVIKFTEIYADYIGKPVEFTNAHGSSDARFFSERDIPVIMLRPNGGGAHGDEEWLSVKSTNDFYNILKKYVTELLQ